MSISLSSLPAPPGYLSTTSDGTFELETPRDRNGTFEPQIVKKYQTTISNEIEEKIISMYGLGMSYRDICYRGTKKYV